MTTKNEETIPDPQDFPAVVEVILANHGLDIPRDAFRRTIEAAWLRLESGAAADLEAFQEVALLAGEIARLQTELGAAQDVLLGAITVDDLEATKAKILAAMSGVDVEEDEPRPAPDFQGFVAALREEREWSATIHKDDDVGQAASDQAALHRVAEHVERVGKQLGLWEHGPQEPAGETIVIEMATGELVEPDPLRTWPIYVVIDDEDLNPYFAIRGDGQVFFHGKEVEKLPPYQDVFDDDHLLVPRKVPAGSQTTWYGVYCSYRRRSLQ
jgi:hypothetical protein